MLGDGTHKFEFRFKNDSATTRTIIVDVGGTATLHSSIVWIKNHKVQDGIEFKFKHVAAGTSSKPLIAKVKFLAGASSADYVLSPAYAYFKGNGFDTADRVDIQAVHS